MRKITSLLDATTGRRIAAATLVAAAGVGLSACSPASNAATPSSVPAAPGSSAPKTPKKPNGVAGQITAEAGNTWTVKTKNGKDFTVTITPNTQYGTKKQPATAQQFPVGAEVRVQGEVTGSTVQAARIAAPMPKTNPSASPAPTTN